MVGYIMVNKFNGNVDSSITFYENFVRKDFDFNLKSGQILIPLQDFDNDKEYYKKAYNLRTKSFNDKLCVKANKKVINNYGESAQVDISLPGQQNEPIIIKLNNKSVKVDTINGKYTFVFQSEIPGNQLLIFSSTTHYGSCEILIEVTE